MSSSRSLANVTSALVIIATVGCNYPGNNQVGRSLDIWKLVELEDLKAIEAYAQSGGDLETGARSQGKTPLLHALKLKKKDSYRKLLSLGASPNTICREGKVVIHSAAAQEDSFWLREALESGGIRI